MVEGAGQARPVQAQAGAGAMRCKPRQGQRQSRTVGHSKLAAAVQAEGVVLRKTGWGEHPSGCAAAQCQRVLRGWLESRRLQSGGILGCWRRGPIRVHSHRDPCHQIVRFSVDDPDLPRSHRRLGSEGSDLDARAHTLGSEPISESLWRGCSRLRPHNPTGPAIPPTVIFVTQPSAKICTCNTPKCCDEP